MTSAAGGCTVRRISESADTLPGRPFWRAVLAWLRALPARVWRYFQARFSDATKSEVWGYAVWSAMGVVVGVPEIWAAVAGDDFVWPTISTTVGHLQERWPVVALFPVATIVIGAYSVLRVPIGDTMLQADFQAIGRTAQGRLAKQDVSLEQLAAGGVVASATDRDEWPVLPYFAFATVVVVAGSLLASASENRFLVGYALYSLIAIFWIVVPNALAYFFGKDFPYTTLFFTVRSLGRRLQFVAAVVAALLVILLLHLAFYPWPSPR